MTSLASRSVRDVPVKTDPAIPGPPRGSARIDVLREYALVADGERGGLIGPHGELAWMCAPRWDSGAVFFGVRVPGGAPGTDLGFYPNRSAAQPM